MECSGRCIDSARRRIAELAFPRRPPVAGIGRVGLEAEFLPFEVVPGRPPRRASLDRVAGALAGLGTWQRDCGASPALDLPGGGRVTFEPGGQVEYSSPPAASAATALEDVERAVAGLRRALRPRRVVLVASGFDRWHPTGSLRRQLDGPRYRAMEQYLGCAGRQMMLRTASLQVNLDLGTDGARRWLAANLVSPLATASFSTSRHAGLACYRARTWQRLDPARTGFPVCLSREAARTPGRAWAEMALRAPVLAFPGGACEPGWTMARWIAEGHPAYGRPSDEDLADHLTTLFPEVRLRGFLELRSADALPCRWRAAAVVFWTGLLYCRSACRRVVEELGGLRAELPELWRLAALAGLADPGLWAVTVRVWRIALDGARRLPVAFLRRSDLETAEAFCRRYIGAECCRSLATDSSSGHPAQASPQRLWIGHPPLTG